MRQRTARWGVLAWVGLVGITVAGFLLVGTARECRAGDKFFKHRGVSRGYAIGYVASPAPVAVTYQAAPTTVQYSVQSAPAVMMVAPAQQETPPTMMMMSVAQPQVAATQSPVNYTVAAAPTAHYVLVPAPAQGQVRASWTPTSGGNLFLSSQPGLDGLSLEADEDAILLRSDPQYLLLSSRMGGEFQVRALKNELRAKLARELRRGRITLRGINWPRLMFKVARTFFFSTYGGDIPVDLFRLIERLIVDVLKEEGIDAQTVPGGGSDDGGSALPFDGQGTDAASGRRYRIQGTIELIGEGGDDGRPDVAPLPPRENPADEDDQDAATPAAPPRR